MSRELIFKAVLEDGEFKAKLDSLSQSAENADGSINELTAASKSLGNQLKTGAGISEFNKATDQSTAALSKQANEIKEVNVELKKESTTLKTLKTETESVNKAKGSLTSQARKLKNELVALELAGKRDTDQFRALSLEAAKLKDAIGDVAQRTKALASDTASFDAFADGIQGIAGGFAAAQGFAALFGAENEEVEKAMLKVQASLAIVNGLQAVFNTLNKDSAFLTIATAKANTLTSATFRLLGLSVTATSTAFKVLRGALIATGIGAIVVLLGALVSVFDEVSSSANNSNESIDNLNSSLENLEATAQDIRSAQLKSLVELAFAQGRITEGLKDELLSREEVRKAIQEVNKSVNEAVDAGNKLRDDELKQIDATIAKTGDRAELEERNTSASRARLTALNILEKQREGIIIERVSVISKAEKERVELIESIESTAAANKAKKDIEALQKRRETNRQEAEKRALDEQKVIDAFNALILKGFTDRLDDENKIRNESFEKSAALQTAFLALPEKERLRLKGEFDQLILDEEGKLQEKLKNFRIEKERESAEAALAIRTDSTQSEALNVELQALRQGSEIKNQIQLDAANDLARQQFDILRQQLVNEKNARILSGVDVEVANEQLNTNLLIADEELKQKLVLNEQQLAEQRTAINKAQFEQQFQAFSQFANSIIALNAANIAADLENLQTERKKALDNFKGSEAQRLRIEEQFAARERAIKRRQAVADRNAALFQIAINTAIAVMKVTGQVGVAAPGVIPLIIATGALQAAAVLSRPLPEFGKGGWINGKSHSRGGVPLVAEGDEFIVKKAAAKKHAGFLEALNRNDGSFERMIFHNFVMPELLGLNDKKIIVNSVFKAERIESELRRTRRAQEMQNDLLITTLNQNKSQNKRSIWLN